jgi:outer membrane lipoprotein carrier protein
MVLRGVPKGLEERFHQVLLEVTPDHQIARILIYAVDDSITEYRFSNLKENVPLANSQFSFTPAPGTEVIDEAATN